MDELENLTPQPESAAPQEETPAEAPVQTAPAEEAQNAEAPAEEKIEVTPEQAEEELLQAERAIEQADAAEAPAQPAPAPVLVTVADIHFRNNDKTYFFDPNGFSLTAGSHVIIDTARGNEFGYCSIGNHSVPSADVVQPLRKVLRLATPQDERVNNENQEKEKRAFGICMQKIADHKLDMQLVSAECAFDGSKLLFFFTADGRVDFRELVKDLASVFRTRIELRQIGVRDKAKMVGGLGICGRPFCCREFLSDFQPVSIKMAKTQNLSLNPTKISGTCGRLMCCLKYEQDAYEDLLRTSPKAESFVDTPDGRGTVIEVNLLKQCVKVRMEDHPDTVGCYRNCDICVLRSGKARKNDLPIPRDVAPISSQPRPVVKPAEPAALDPMPELIYPDSVAPVTQAEQPAAKAAEPQEPEAPQSPDAEKPGQPRRRRRGRGRGHGTGAPQDAAVVQPRPITQPRPANQPRPDGQPPRPDQPRRRRRRPGGSRPPEGPKE
jgi:cell fate regulator YaaT (PSP1 superfamily)